MVCTFVSVSFWSETVIHQRPISGWASFSWMNRVLPKVNVANQAAKTMLNCWKTSAGSQPVSKCIVFEKGRETAAAPAWESARRADLKHSVIKDSRCARVRVSVCKSVTLQKCSGGPSCFCWHLNALTVRIFRTEAWKTWFFLKKIVKFCKFFFTSQISREFTIKLVISIFRIPFQKHLKDAERGKDNQCLLDGRFYCILIT